MASPFKQKQQRRERKREEKKGEKMHTLTEVNTGLHLIKTGKKKKREEK